MKIVFVLPFLLLLVSCQKKQNTKGFYVTVDTLHVSLAGKVCGGVKLGNKYYMYHKADYTGGNFDLSWYLCIVNQNGRLVDSVYVSDDMDVNKHLIARNDSVILRSNSDNNEAYYLNEYGRKWVAFKNTDYTLFEDGNYLVTSSDYGEWGGATWFKDKKTGVQYEADVIMPEIHKINNIYYLVSKEGIDIVKNPKRMSNAGNGNYGMLADSTSFKRFYNRKRPANRMQGVERIFEDTISKYDDYYKSNIRKSFIHNDSLYFIFQDDIEDKTFIAKIHDKQMIPVLTLQDIHVAQYLNTYRNTNELAIPFKNNKTSMRGMLEINGKNIYLHYIKNTPPKK